MSLPPSLRRVAVLISALDAETADAVFAQMSADDAAKIRSALVELDDISPEEQQNVLTAFLREQGNSSKPPAITENVMLELNPVLEAAAANDNARIGSGPAPQLPESPS